MFSVTCAHCGSAFEVGMKHYSSTAVRTGSGSTVAMACARRFFESGRTVSELKELGVSYLG